MEPDPTNTADQPQAGQTIVRFERENGSCSYGVLSDGQIAAVSGDIFGNFTVEPERFSLREIKLLAPIEPNRVYGVGMNSHSYRRYRMGTDYPGIDSTEPPVFEKSSAAVVGPDSQLVVPKGLSGVSGSPELAVIINRRASQITESEVFDYILGYSASFDAMSPEVAVEDMLAAKDFPTFCPLGPWIKTALDLSDLEVTLSVNGKMYHQGFTSDFIYDIPRVVSFLAGNYTLEPGDVILMGAMGKEAIVDGETVDFVPRFSDLGEIRPVAYPKYLPGDQMVVRVQGIGELRFEVAAAG